MITKLVIILPIYDVASKPDTHVVMHIAKTLLNHVQIQKSIGPPLSSELAMTNGTLGQKPKINE